MINTESSRYTAGKRLNYTAGKRLINIESSRYTAGKCLMKYKAVHLDRDIYNFYQTVPQSTGVNFKCSN